MMYTQVNYIKGARKTYPQWDDINAELQEKIKRFHNKLREEGYDLKATNIAHKDKKLFWILSGTEGFYLEQYAILN